MYLLGLKATTNIMTYEPIPVDYDHKHDPEHCLDAVMLQISMCRSEILERSLI
jgi:hypothetical protein